MKESSNEPKKQRNKRVWAILKVTLKRYSFIIGVPILLYVFYMVGIIMREVDKNFLPTSFSTILWGFYAIILVIVGIAGTVFAIFLLFGLLLYEAFRELIAYLKERRIRKDLQTIGKKIVEFFKRICFRIKEEPKRFKEAVKEQEMKQTEKENNESE